MGFSSLRWTPVIYLQCPERRSEVGVVMGMWVNGIAGCWVSSSESMFFMFWDASSHSSSENGKGRIGDFEGRGRALVFSGGFEGKAFKELEHRLLVEPTAHSRSGISGEAR